MCVLRKYFNSDLQKLINVEFFFNLACKTVGILSIALLSRFLFELYPPKNVRSL